MINNIARKFFSNLSFFYKNNLKLVEKKNYFILPEINKKLKRLSFSGKNLKKTHNQFNKEILKLLKKNELTRFLKNGFIQKMFFVHNRIFILYELSELKKDKNWKFYKRLIVEDNVGDPVRYFLYPKSSGNRINHVYHLSILANEFNINLKKIYKVFEFGGGYGCMARVFSKINKKITYTCFDTSYVNLLQYYYLRQNNLNVGFTKKNNFFLISDLKNNNNFNHNLFLANWSLSETPIKFRKKFFNIIKNSNLLMISFQKDFEKIDNLKYFKNLKKRLKNKFDIRIIKNNFYKGNIFKPQNHYFLVGKKL